MNSPSKQTLVMASGNKGKLREFNILLSDFGFDVKPQSDFDVSDAEETGLTFVENAIIKARNACLTTNLPSIADDSGIEVDALSGEPGIYSARFSGKDANDEKNNQKLLSLLADLPKEKRSARYQCILVYMRHAKDPTPLIAQASWEGLILEEPLGGNGFGYDPIFWVPSHNCSSAQLDKDEKNKISHRALALKELVAQIGSKHSSK